MKPFKIRAFAKMLSSVTLAFLLVFQGMPLLKVSAVAPMTASGTAAEPYVITTAAELAEIPTLGLSAYYKLGNDIDLTSYGTWTPIGSATAAFSGTFDGNGHTIRGLSIGSPGTYSSAKYAGLFGCVNGATIENLSVSAGIYTQENYAGGIAGYGSATIKNCSVNGDVFGSDDAWYIGGIIGDLTSGALSDDKSYAEVQGLFYVGGVAGTIDMGTVTYSCSEGTVVGLGNCAYVGGFTGSNAASIKNCYSTGCVENSLSPDANYLGGFVGVNTGTIFDSYATGGIYSEATDVGGFAGFEEQGNIENCYSLGNVSGLDNIGGFVGYDQGQTEICYSAGSVSSVFPTAQNVYGFVGKGTGSIGLSYWDSDENTKASASASPYTQSIVGKTYAEMTSPDFATLLNNDTEDFAFTNNLVSWGQSPSVNSKYPYLMGVGLGTDKTPPTGTFAVSSSGGTETITLTASDNLSGVSFIILPNGKIQGGSVATYTVNQNGDYVFDVYDNAGNMAAMDKKITDFTTGSYTPGVTYAAHVQHIGWMAPVSDGTEAGTEHRSLSMEAVQLKLTGNLPAGASIVYQAHVQSKGWLSPVSDNAIGGTTGKSLRLEALRVTLKGLSGYAVKYRAYVQNKGWLDWQQTENGTDISGTAIAGTTGKGLRVEAIEIQIVKIP